MENGEKIRVTLAEKSGAKGSAVRVQVRDVEEHLRQGPEITTTEIRKVIEAMIELVRK